MRKALIKKEKYVEFFQGLARSKEVQSFENKALLYAFMFPLFSGDEIPGLIEKIRILEKEVENGRAPINDILNDMKRLNQNIYQPLKDNLRLMASEAKAKYNSHIQEKARKKRELQAKLDREAEQKRIKQQREIEEAKKNGKAPPPEVIIPTPQIKEVDIVKSVGRKEIKVTIKDKIAFIKDAIKRNDPELLDCIEITKTTGMVNQAKRNPGEVEIEGVDILYYPTREAWGIVDTAPGA
jgi:hypothetical protein